MPVFKIDGPNGEVYEVDAPDGASKAQAFEFFKREHAAGRAKPIKPKPPTTDDGSDWYKNKLQSLFEKDVNQEDIAQKAKAYQQPGGALQALDDSFGNSEGALAYWKSVLGGIEQIPAALQATLGVTGKVAGGIAGIPFGKSGEWGNTASDFIANNTSALTPHTQAGKAQAGAISALIGAGVDWSTTPENIKTMLGSIPLVGENIKEVPEIQAGVSALATALPDLAMAHPVASLVKGLVPQRPIDAVNKHREWKKRVSREDITDQLVKEQGQDTFWKDRAAVMEAQAKAEKEKQERNDATVARLQAAVDKQNPQQPIINIPAEPNSIPITVSPEGVAYLNSPGAEAGRQQYLDIEQRKKEAIDKEVSSFNSLQNQLQEAYPNRPEEKYSPNIDPVQKTTEENAAWNQYNSEKQAQQKKQAEIDAFMLRREEELSKNEQTLREEAYKPTYDGQGPKTRAEQARKLSEGRGGSQRGALGPEVFAQGFRAASRALSELTDSPWVQQRFPKEKYLTNKDGTPMILLHGTTEGFNDEVRTDWEGVHAGYGAEAAHIFTADRKSSPLSKALPGTLKYGKASAIYPMAVKKGVYPHINTDIGAWSPEDILNSHTDKPNSVVVKAIADETNLDRKFVESILDKAYNQLKGTGLDIAGWNKTFSKILKDTFGIDGFFYKNSYESSKSLIKEAGGTRAEMLSDKLDHNTSFVTWDDKNLESLYGETPSQLKHPQNTWMGSLGGMGKSQQGGVLFPKFLSDVVDRFSKPTLPPNSPPVKRSGVDSVETPKSPENIAKKQEIVSKMDALKVGDSQYHRVTTYEEAVSDINPKTDMSPAGATNLRSGLAGAVRTNVKNKVLNYVRNLTQEGRNQRETNVRQFVTNPVDGYVKLLKQLSSEEKTNVAETLLLMDKAQIKPSREVYDRYKLTDKERAVAEAHVKAMDALWEDHVKAAASIGVSVGPRREGYLPHNFSGDYTSIMGFTDKNGVFVPRGLAQADTKYGHAAAVEKYKELGEQFAVEKRLPRKTLKDSHNYSKVYSGFNDLVVQLAKIDPRFAEAKAIVDEHSAKQVAKLYSFNKHDLKRTGVHGYIGDRPWLSKEQNAKELFDSIINHLEQGFEYNAMQKPIHEMHRLVTNPDVLEKLPNTAVMLNKHIEHLKGNNLNSAGAALNKAVDLVVHGVSNLTPAGFGPSTTRKVLRGITEVSTSMLTEFCNLGYLALQLTQAPIAMMAEVPAIRETTGLSHTEVLAKSIPATMMDMAKLVSGNREGLRPHMLEAWDWAHSVGLFNYTESHTARDLTQGKLVAAARFPLHIIGKVGENLTRPPVFMFFVDMFDRAGFKGEDGFLRAQEAANSVMVDYDKHERPAIYNTFGEFGKALGAFATFKHNFVEQQVSRVVNAKQQKEAAGAALAVAAGLYGVSGLPGYQEADWFTKLLPGNKSIRELVMGDPTQPNWAMDGVASWYTGVDIQSRVSSADMVPDVQSKSLVHIANFADIVGKAFTAAKDMDTASIEAAKKALMPTAIKNAYEVAHSSTEVAPGKFMVYDEKGLPKLEEPRTKEQQNMRAVLGLKPLQERINSETLYTMSEREKLRKEQVKTIETRFDNAIRNGDDVSKLIDRYQELGEDPSTLKKRAHDAMTAGSLSPKQRREGIPKNNMRSVQRYNAYQQ